MSDFFAGMLTLAGIIAFLSIPLAWLTHVIWWISLAMNEELNTGGEWILAILGTLFFPIGVVHGYVLWF